MFNINSAFAAMKDPAEVFKKHQCRQICEEAISRASKLGDNDELWDSKKDRIRTVDWEAVCKEHAGKTVRFAIGAADKESAQDGVAR